MDLTRQVTYRGTGVNVTTLVVGKPGATGLTSTNTDISQIEEVGYTERRRIADGITAIEPYHGSWPVTLNGVIFGLTRVEAFASLQTLRELFNPVKALMESPSTKGFLPLTFYEPHDSPSVITQRVLQARPLGLRWQVVPEVTGNAARLTPQSDLTSLAIKWSTTLLVEIGPDLPDDGAHGGHGGGGEDSGGGGGSGSGSDTSIFVDKEPEDQVVPPGTAATFTIEVGNNGNRRLESISVADAVTPSCVRDVAAINALIAAAYPGNPPGILLPGQSVTYECATGLLYADIVNTAIATGYRSPAGPRVTAQDSVTVEVGELVLHCGALGPYELHEWGHYVNPDYDVSTLPGWMNIGPGAFGFGALGQMVYTFISADIGVHLEAPSTPPPVIPGEPYPYYGWQGAWLHVEDLLVNAGYNDEEHTDPYGCVAELFFQFQAPTDPGVPGHASKNFLAMTVELVPEDYPGDRLTYRSHIDGGDVQHTFSSALQSVTVGPPGGAFPGLLRNVRIQMDARQLKAGIKVWNDEDDEPEAFQVIAWKEGWDNPTIFKYVTVEFHMVAGYPEDWPEDPSFYFQFFSFTWEIKGDGPSVDL